MPEITIEDILRGTTMGNMQSVGQMGVIPLIDEDGSASDDTIAPPDNLNVRTSTYGAVDVENLSDSVTFVPSGAAWMPKLAVQDHAIPTAIILAPKMALQFRKAMCIEETQGGLIPKDKHALTILPYRLRKVAVAKRNESEYNRLWQSIRIFNRDAGIEARGNLSNFESRFGKELDEFVAEFEIVPKQIGAVILLNDAVVGVERAPNHEYWKAVWVPLIRMCYGSLAVTLNERSLPAPFYRKSLPGGSKNIGDLRQALKKAKEETIKAVSKVFDNLLVTTLKTAPQIDQVYGNIDPIITTTVACKSLSGQIIERKNKKVLYASLCGG